MSHTSSPSPLPCPANSTISSCKIAHSPHSHIWPAPARTSSTLYRLFLHNLMSISFGDNPLLWPRGYHTQAPYVNPLHPPPEADRLRAIPCLSLPGWFVWSVGPWGRLCPVLSDIPHPYRLRLSGWGTFTALPACARGRSVPHDNIPVNGRFIWLYHYAVCSGEWYPKGWYQ